MDNNLIFGIRPVVEAIEAGREIEKLYIRKGAEGQLMTELRDLCLRHRVRVQEVPVEKLNRLVRGNHQGVVAQIAAIAYVQLDDILERVPDDETPLVVVFDGVTDVRNFGAIARTAECAGVDAIVIPQHGSVSVGGDAVKTSAGALLHIPVCRERSVRGAVQFLKDNGYRVVAVSEKADINYTEANFTDPVALVMGAEDVGISPDVYDLCDLRVGIPMFGKIGSLNVSVAAGVLMYEVVRQRLAANLEVI
mgnify:CR=1 FL=1